MSGRLFNPRTKVRKRLRFAGFALGIGLGLGLIFAVMAYYITRGRSDLALYGFLLSIGAGLLLAPLALLVQPTVRCRGCDGCGWIVDLAETGPRCPLCGGDSFDYRSTAFALEVPVTIRHDEIGGEELVKKDRGWWSSYD